MKEISEEDLEQLKNDFRFIISNANFESTIYSASMKGLERMAQILGKLTSQEKKD